MWGGNKVWLYYQKDIIAADVYAANFTALYLRYVSAERLYCWQLEVFDLQRYTLITKPKKVYQAIREKAGSSFMFIVGKN